MNTFCQMRLDKAGFAYGPYLNRVRTFPDHVPIRGRNPCVHSWWGRVDLSIVLHITSNHRISKQKNEENSKLRDQTGEKIIDNDRENTRLRDKQTLNPRPYILNTVIKCRAGHCGRSCSWCRCPRAPPHHVYSLNHNKKWGKCKIER